MEKWINSRVIYKGSILSLRTGVVKIANGKIYKREIVENSGAVAIVPMLDESIILVRQFRIAIGQFMLEIPAGRIEGMETPYKCAIRELEEETGYITNDLMPLIEYYPAVGFSTEKIYIFLAKALSEGTLRHDPDENLEVVKLPIDKVKLMLENREFKDSKTIIGLREALNKY